MTADTRPLELRVHGVHGTPPETMLDDPHPEHVAGDAEARFFGSDRSQDGVRVEAFHWGRMTSGSASRALWLLFLPFTLINLARYTLLTWDDALMTDGADPARGVPARLADGLLRVVGLVMTVVVVVTAVYVAAEVVVDQCLLRIECAHDNPWLAIPGVASPTLGQGLLAAAVPVAVVLGLIAVLGRRPSTRAPGPPPRWLVARRFGDEEFWLEVSEVALLRRCHVAAASATAGLLFATTTLTPGAPAWTTLLVALGGILVAVGLAVTAAIGAMPSWLVALLPVVCGAYALGGVTVAVALHWDVRDGSSRGPLPGLETVANVLAAALMVLVLGVAVVSAVLARRFERWESGLTGGPGRPVRRPSSFAPMWAGLGPAVAVALGIGLLVGTCTGVIFHVADSLGEPVAQRGARVAVPDPDQPAEILLSTGYWTAASLAGLVVLLIVLGAAPLAAFLLQRRAATWFLVPGALTAGAATATAAFGRMNAVAWVAVGAATLLVALGALAWARDRQVQRLADGIERHAAPPDDGATTTPVRAALVEPLARRARRVAVALRRGQSKHRWSLALGVVAAAFGIAVVAAGVIGGWRLVDPGSQAEPPRWLLPLIAPTQREEALRVTLPLVGAWTVAAAVVVVVGLGIRSFRRPEVRTAVGVLWDLMSFWPRLVHPLSPPPYGGRAVLEVADRVTWAADRCGRRAVVLSGHSQGSLICVAAAIRIARTPSPDGGERDVDEEGRASQARGTLALLTYGSQLQWAFARLFPCFVGFHHQDQLYRDLDGRWRNIYRETDPLGGAVLAWPVEPWNGPFHDPPAAARGSVGHRHPDPTSDAGTTDSAPHDVRWVDPASMVRGQESVLPPIRGHSGYYTDDRYRAVREALVQAVAPEQPPSA